MKFYCRRIEVDGLNCILNNTSTIEVNKQDVKGNMSNVIICKRVNDKTACLECENLVFEA